MLAVDIFGDSDGERCIEAGGFGTYLGKFIACFEICDVNDVFWPNN